ncbi:hypothetical protein HELRODRAFT_158835 [Helobdella robusta]|uniref:Uncharacterized protein n=1 Tax=Helobdella robusta TaxID=6412 RepID=T1ENB5_HELRO|nr:hypothetical protein HELRODRAFT_158835 [Helobdella robusta]ESO12334.1 hypothetical protein HELRODRAFT_158835 [Helobdella robusta]
MSLGRQKFVPGRLLLHFDKPATGSSRRRISTERDARLYGIINDLASGYGNFCTECKSRKATLTIRPSRRSASRIHQFVPNRMASEASEYFLNCIKMILRQVSDGCTNCLKMFRDKVKLKCDEAKAYRNQNPLFGSPTISNCKQD